VKASAINYLVDAGPLVAHFDAFDQWHKWAAATIRALGETLHITPLSFHGEIRGILMLSGNPHYLPSLDALNNFGLVLLWTGGHIAKTLSCKASGLLLGRLSGN
jgi:hypothetical protein